MTYSDKNQGFLFAKLILSLRKFLNWESIITVASINDITNLKKYQNFKYIFKGKTYIIILK